MTLGGRSVEVVLGVTLALGRLPDIGWAGEVLVYVREVEVEKGGGVVGEGDGCEKRGIADDVDGRGQHG